MTGVTCLQILKAKVSSEITSKALTWSEDKYERARLKCTYRHGGAHRKRLFSTGNLCTPISKLQSHAGGGQ